MMPFSLTATICSAKLGLDVCINYNHAHRLCRTCPKLHGRLCSENVVFPDALIVLIYTFTVNYDVAVKLSHWGMPRDKNADNDRFVLVLYRSVSCHFFAGLM